MPPNDAERMEALIQRLYRVRQQYYDLIEAGVEQVLGSPADPARLDALEAELGQELPPSYRLFLTLHDGWAHWEGDIHMLSVEQMRGGEYGEWVRRWKEECAARGDDIVARGHVMACQLHADTGLVAQLHERDARGEAEIVNWDRSPIGRYRDFWELLADDVEEWESLVAEEREGEAGTEA